jgi:hypothetical protein
MVIIDHWLADAERVRREEAVEIDGSSARFNTKEPTPRRRRSRPTMRRGTATASRRIPTSSTVRAPESR